MRDLIIIKKKEAVYYKLLSVLYFLIDCLQKTDFFLKSRKNLDGKPNQAYI